MIKSHTQNRTFLAVIFFKLAQTKPNGCRGLWLIANCHPNQSKTTVGGISRLLSQKNNNTPCDPTFPYCEYARR